jgi:hypothetical protein
MNQITAAAMSGLSLQCGNCGVLLQSVEEAQAHAESMSHTNFAESTEVVLPQAHAASPATPRP